MRTTKDKFDTRKLRVRKRISKFSDRNRLSVFKSGRHLYAQIINDVDSTTIASVSTLDKSIRKLKSSNCNVGLGTKIGELIAKKALASGVNKVVFDKGGYKYHGVIKALADAARKDLNF